MKNEELKYKNHELKNENNWKNKKELFLACRGLLLCHFRLDLLGERRLLLLDDLAVRDESSLLGGPFHQTAFTPEFEHVAPAFGRAEAQSGAVALDKEQAGASGDFIVAETAEHKSSLLACLYLLGLALGLK